jgi:hypothetical protein
MNGKRGTIVAFDDPSYGIKFDERISGLHSLGGRIEDGYGWWVTNTMMTLLPKEEKSSIKPESAMKLSVGDRVIIRYWDDMAADERVDKADKYSIVFKGDSTCFNNSMSKYSGQQATIKGVNSYGNIELTDWSAGGAGGGWNYKPWMVRLVKKAAPKKQLSVAEVEKLLGYGVEIVKEGK